MCFYDYKTPLHKLTFKIHIHVRYIQIYIKQGPQGPQKLKFSKIT